MSNEHKRHIFYGGHSYSFMIFYTVYYSFTSHYFFFGAKSAQIYAAKNLQHIGKSILDRMFEHHNFLQELVWRGIHNVSKQMRSSEILVSL